MANCSNCSAPLPPNTTLCTYCGSRNDVDLGGVHHYTTHAAESNRICPRCNIPLKTLDLQLDGKFLIERCDKCLGLFFDPNELETLIDATVKNVYTVNRSELNSIAAMAPNDYGIHYIKCPVCGNFMNRVNFGAKSGVVVDRCKDHGVWLDGGELRQLLEWTKAGGKLLDEQRKEQLKNEEQRAREWEERSRHIPTGTGGGYSGPVSGPFEDPFRSPEADLLELAVRTVGYFISRL